MLGVPSLGHSLCLKLLGCLRNSDEMESVEAVSQEKKRKKKGKKGKKQIASDEL